MKTSLEKSINELRRHGDGSFFLGRDEIKPRMGASIPDGMEFSKNGALFLNEPAVRPYCGPLFFSRSLNLVTDNIIANGSFGLVNTGQKKLLVTCHHVWEEFQKLQMEDSDLKIHICLNRNPLVALQEEPIDQDKGLDIVTFDMEPLLATCSGIEFYSLAQNPPRRVVRGDRIFLIGYPSVFRSITEKGVGFGGVPYSVFVSSADGLRFHSDISKAKYEEAELVTQTRRHGGISGSPCFVVRQNRPVQLVGFATGNLISHSMDYLCFTHALCLNSDGTINRQSS